MTWMIFLYFCTADLTCYTEKPQPRLIYDTLEKCQDAIDQRGHDILTEHFQENDTNIAIWCDDSRKSLLSPPQYPKYDGTDEPHSETMRRVIDEMKTYEPPKKGS